MSYPTRPARDIEPGMVTAICQAYITVTDATPVGDCIEITGRDQHGRRTHHLVPARRRCTVYRVDGTVTAEVSRRAARAAQEDVSRARWEAQR
jgi:hypothetical protein